MSNNSAKTKDVFQHGIACFRAQKYEDALKYLTKAIALGGLKDATVYDSRAAVYEKLARPKDALLDSKEVIKIAPERWQGYARSARLFSSIRKYGPALQMINLALERIDSGDQKRRVELETLRSEIEANQASYLERQRQHASKTFYHFGQLPIEIASAIFADVLESDPAQVIGLSHVCRDWRRVVLEMPSAWSHLSLSNRNPRAKAKLWKDRSRGRVKSLSLHPENSNSKAMYALELLNDIPFHHLRSLSLNSVDWAKFRQTLPLLTNDVIRQLDTIRVDNAIWMPGVDWFFEQSELNVRHLTVLNADINWRSLSDNCTKLVTLSYSGWFHQEYFLDVLVLLHHNPGLEKLHLDMTIKGPIMFRLDQERRHPLPETFSVLPNLVELSLEGSELAPYSLTSIILAPKLQVLKLTKCPGPLDESLIHLLDHDCIPHLRELVIDRCVLRDGHILVELLTRATSLQTLHLKYMHNIKHVLDAISEPASQSTGTPSVLLPNLTHLDLSHCPEVRDGVVIRTVKLRIPPQPQEGSQDAPSNQVDKPTPLLRTSSQLSSLDLHGCDISGEVLQWSRKYVSRVESRWATKKQASWRR